METRWVVGDDDNLVSELRVEREGELCAHWSNPYRSNSKVKINLNSEYLRSLLKRVFSKSNSFSHDLRPVCHGFGDAQFMCTFVEETLNGISLGTSVCWRK